MPWIRWLRTLFLPWAGRRAPRRNARPRGQWGLSFEALESRTCPTIDVLYAAGTVQFTEDPGTPGASDTLLLATTADGKLSYSSPGGDTFVGTAPGLTVGPGLAIVVDLGGGTNTLGLDDTNAPFTSPVTFHGGSGFNTLSALNQQNIWQLTGPNAGLVTLDGGATLTFDHTQNLVGGTAGDDFQIGPNASLDGTLDGNLGDNTLDYSQVAGGRTISLTDLGGSDGFDGTEALLGGGFLNITTAIGSASATTNTLIAAPSLFDVWSITGQDSGDVDGGLFFQGFQNLTGGASGADFVFAPGGQVAGDLDGGGGYASLDYSGYGSAVTVDTTVANATTGVGGTLRGIQFYTGSPFDDTFRLTAQAYDQFVEGGGGSDVLQEIGTGPADGAVYMPDAATPGIGTITDSLQPGALTFSDFAGVDVTGFASAKLVTPNGADDVTVQDGTDFRSGLTPAVLFSGTSGGVAFAPLAVWNDTGVTLDTAANDTASDNGDTVTVNKTATNGLTDLAILTWSNFGDADHVRLLGNVTASSSVVIDTGDLSNGGASLSAQAITLTAHNGDIGGPGAPINLTSPANTSTLTVDSSGANGDQFLSGSGTLTVSGLAAGAGAVTLAGQYVLGTDNALSVNGLVTVPASSELDLHGHTATVGSLTGDGQVDLGGGQLFAGAGTVPDTTFGGVINGPGGLVKQGSGTFILSGTANTYTGVQATGGILVVNDPLTPPDQPFAEGSAVTVSGAGPVRGTADIVPGFSYAWAVTKDGAPYTTGTGSPFQFTPDDNGTYVVTLTATDNNQGSIQDSQTIAVANMAPTPVILGAALSGPGGTAILLTGTATDPSTADTRAGLALSWAVTRDGTLFASGTGPTFSFTPAGSGPYVATLTATDKDQASSSVSQPVAVTPQFTAAATTFAVGAAGDFTVGTPGFPVSSVSMSGDLPAGVHFTDNGNGTATLAGVPVLGTQGVYPLTLTAHNGAGGDVTQTFMLIVANTPAPVKVYVNPAFTGAAGADPDGSGPATAIGYDAFATIQQALNAVATGGTVVVEAGTYAEALTLVRPVMLQGAGSGSTVLAGQSVARGVAGLNVTADGDVAVSGLTVEGYTAGLLAGGATRYLGLTDVRFTANTYGSCVNGVGSFLVAGGAGDDTFFATAEGVDRQGDDPVFYQHVGSLTLDGGAGSNSLFVFLNDTKAAATVWVAAGGIARDRVPFALLYRATGGTFGGGVSVIVGTGPETVVVQGQLPGSPLAVLGQGGNESFLIAVTSSSNYSNLLFEGGGGTNTLYIMDESGTTGAADVQGAGAYGEFDLVYAGGGRSRIDYLNVQQLLGDLPFTTFRAASE